MPSMQNHLFDAPHPTHSPCNKRRNQSSQCTVNFQSGGAPNFTDFNAILSANHSLEAVNDHLHCAGDKPWLASYKPSDCAWAPSGLQDKAAQFGDEAFSWPAIAARGKLKYEAVSTPIRYKWSQQYLRAYSLTRNL